MIRSDSVVSLGVTWLISRHKGAIDWVKAHDLSIDRWVPHLDPDDVNAGDTVIGSLPVNLAAAICKRGARYFHLSVVVPATLHGQDLSAAEMMDISAKLQAFHVEELSEIS